jgi:hypothetical protein
LHRLQRKINRKGHKEKLQQIALKKQFSFIASANILLVESIIEFLARSLNKA